MFIQIQVQDLSGNWRTYGRTQNVPAMILREMRAHQGNNPGRRVRAVDESGRLVDML